MILLTICPQFCTRMSQTGSQHRTVLFSLSVVVGVWCTFVTGGPSSTSRPSTFPSGAANECAKEDAACIKEWLEREAIGALHRQIDDDHNGDVDLSESDGFIRDELQYEDDFDRHNVLHRGDKFISVADLWTGWKNSEVYNWSVEQTVHWLCEFVELPQYSETFQNNAIEGTTLPRLAVNSAQFMTAILGISNPIDRQKISLKAMDVVLFGPPKPHHSYLKDWMLVVSLVVAVGGCWFAYSQHRYSQSHVKEMLKEMESLQKAEDALTEMQEKLSKAQEEHKSALMEKETIKKLLTDEISKAKQEAERLRAARTNNHTLEDGEECDVELADKLRLAEEELVQVRNALQEAERQIESGCSWVPPSELLRLLQITHEQESKFHSVKRQAAERQLREAKDVCDKIRKKRTTFMGSFRIAHGSTLDEVDHRIVKARSALVEVTNEIQERGSRWSQIESMCNFTMTRSPSGSFSATLMHQTDSFSLNSSAGSVIGSLQQLAGNPSMGLDECDEDLPPKPIGPIPGGFPHSLTSSNISQSVDHIPSSIQSMKQSKSVSSLQAFSRNGGSSASLRSRVSPSTPPSGNGFIVGGDSSLDSPDVDPLMSRSDKRPNFPISTQLSSSSLPSTSSPKPKLSQRPKSLPVSQSESSLEEIALSPDGNIRKELWRRSLGLTLDEEEVNHSSDGAETSDDNQSATLKKRHKLHVRIPKFSNKNTQSVKTC